MLLFMKICDTRIIWGLFWSFDLHNRYLSRMWLVNWIDLTHPISLCSCNGRGSENLVPKPGTMIEYPAVKDYCLLNM